MPTKFDISIDPGLNETGVCVWQDGFVIGHPQILRLPTGAYGPKTFEQKLYVMLNRLDRFLTDILSHKGGQYIDQFVVEEFETFQKATMQSMMKCAAVQGGIFALGMKYAERPRLVSKKQASKSEAAWLAKGMGITATSHALDAFHIGVCAGLDKRSGR